MASSYLKMLNKTTTCFNHNYFSHICKTHHNNHPESYHNPTVTFEWLPLIYWCFCLFVCLLKKEKKWGTSLTSLVLARSLCLSAGGVNPILTPRAYVCVKLCMGSCSDRPRRVSVSRHGKLKRIPFPYIQERGRREMETMIKIPFPWGGVCVLSAPSGH